MSQRCNIKSQSYTLHTGAGREMTTNPASHVWQMVCAPVREIYSSDPTRGMPNATIPDAVSKFMAAACSSSDKFLHIHSVQNK